MQKRSDVLSLKELMLLHWQRFAIRCLTWYIYQVRHMLYNLEAHRMGVKRPVTIRMCAIQGSFGIYTKAALDGAHPRAKVRKMQSS
jgi:hypothetical protein